MYIDVTLLKIWHLLIQQCVSRWHFLLETDSVD